MEYSNIAAELAATPWFYVLAGILGAVFGSFSGVLVERIPAKAGINSRSACASCGVQLRAWENIPVVSWLAQGGKCRTCKAPIPARVWGIEVASAAGWVAGAWLTQDPLGAIAFGMVVCFSLVLGILDWKTSYIAMGPYLGFGVAAWVFTAASVGLSGDWGRLWLGLGLGVGTAVFFEVINGLYLMLRGQHGLGGGDSLLVLVSVGVPVALSGDWIVGVYGLVAGFVLGAVIGVVVTSRYAEGVADPYLESAEVEPADGEAEEGAEQGSGNSAAPGDTAAESVGMGKRVFALGPFLIVGPLLVWIVLAVTGFDLMG